MENLAGENPYAPTHPEIRDAVRALCLKFDGAYWRHLDRERGYPTEFVKALTEAELSWPLSIQAPASRTMTWPQTCGSTRARSPGPGLPAWHSPPR